MIVSDSPTPTLPMHPARMLRHITRALALRLLEWSTDHASPAAHQTATQPAGLSHAQRIRRHHLQCALEAERDRATAHAHMGPLAL